MGQIELFVDSVYKNAGGNKKEIQELKAEMKNHLLEAVHELKIEGKSEQDAIAIAIERFGGEKEMRVVVGQLFKAQKIFAKRVLYIAFAFLLISLVASGVIWKVETDNRAENAAISRSLYDVLDKQAVISEQTDKTIKAIVRDAKQITNVQIYKTSEVKTVTAEGSVSYFNHQAEPIYRYVREMRPSSVMDFYYAQSDKWFIHLESKNLATLVGYLLTAGIAIYAVLFTIWATINAYHHQRLNAGWIIGFALFNVLGYLAYFLVGIKARRSNIIS
ncbi:permease prefix domain 1-containing protein [Paenibacillus sp. PL91]|uniref:permease prefix domain 1-containing protein n=1 Tax=Paenibacillus sp. PL91 TaxID=2729538 RepID=UPI00145CA3B2|nr:permease prefix domain 1-containing protein [Paenibacillus sp. PL91]MBC9202666.1 hypothetical protein [Paenibacillus sp. PL91]